MDHHLGILQQRVEAGAVGGQFARHERERMRGEIQQQKEENLHRGNNGGGVGKKPGISFVPQPQNQSVGRQQQRPEQQRTFLARPESGELVRRRQIAIAVVIDVGDGEIILEGGDDQDEGGKKHYGKGGDTGAARGFAQPLRTRARASQSQHSRQERVGTQRQGKQKRETANLRHERPERVFFQKQRVEATGERRILSRKDSKRGHKPRGGGRPRMVPRTGGAL